MGWKCAEYEMKGVPVRVELGPRDIEAGSCVLVRRNDGVKTTVRLDELEPAVREQLELVQTGMFEKAKQNLDSHENVHLGKAGRTRHLGVRPTVRGSVMNPNDHPHGGGEGKSPVGHPGPMTPWGKPAMGLKTRKAKNRTNKYIFKRRNAK